MTHGRPLSTVVLSTNGLSKLANSVFKILNNIKLRPTFMIVKKWSKTDCITYIRSSLITIILWKICIFRNRNPNETKHWLSKNTTLTPITLFAKLSFPSSHYSIQNTNRKIK